MNKCAICSLRAAFACAACVALSFSRSISGFASTPSNWACAIRRPYSCSTSAFAFAASRSRSILNGVSGSIVPTTPAPSALAAAEATSPQSGRRPCRAAFACACAALPPIVLNAVIRNARPRLGVCTPVGSVTVFPLASVTASVSGRFRCHFASAVRFVNSSGSSPAYRGRTDG